MLRKLISVLLFCAAASAIGHAQQIDPSFQVNWPTGNSGCVYSPAGNTCETVILPAPSGAQSITQPSVSAPLSVNYFSQAFANGVVYADKFCGLGTVGGISTPSCSADICSKLLAANQYAVGNNVALVDVSHAQGTQACGTNPFASLNGTPNSPVNLVVNFGVTHFQTSVQWVINNSNITLHGMGAWATQVEYTGANGATAVLYVNGHAGTAPYAATGIQGIQISGMFFYGDAANVADGVLLKFVNRSRFDSMYAWGVTGCGIHTEGAVTDTFLQPRVSFADALFVGILNNATHTTPANGICLDGDATAPGGPEDTTSGTLLDAGMEGVTNAGIYVLSADQMTVQGGTSEQNRYGILIAASASGVNPGTSNKFNKFSTIDLEQNTLGSAGGDVTDGSANNMFENLLATSPCSSCSSVQLSSTGEDYYLVGIASTGVAGQINGVLTPGANATSGTGGSATALPSQPQGYIVEQFQGTNVKIPYYH